MRLMIECEHGQHNQHPVIFADRPAIRCDGGTEVTGPDAILEALAEKGVLEVQISPAGPWFPGDATRYVSPWKEAK